jgi:hypothetical protein
LKLELRGHFILVQFHSGCDAAYLLARSCS